MKRLILFAFLLNFGICLEGQITYEQAQAREIKNGTKYTSYLSKNGTLYEVGKEVTIGKPAGQNGNFVTINNVSLFESSPATSIIAGQTFVIQKITSYKDLSGRPIVNLVFEGGDLLLGKYALYIEQALEMGELKPDGLSSEEALRQLKLAKEKRDLDLITEEEYLKILYTLRPLIK